MTDPHPTSLSDLSEHDWQIIRNRFARGQDWYVGKVGKRYWEITCPTVGRGFPLFKTKREAEEKAANLILMESRSRSAKANGLPTY